MLSLASALIVLLCSASRGASGTIVLVAQYPARSIKNLLQGQRGERRIFEQMIPTWPDLPGVDGEFLRGADHAPEGLRGAIWDQGPPPIAPLIATGATFVPKVGL